MNHQRLRYNFFINTLGRKIYVVPEGKTGGPNSRPIGDFKLEQGDQRPFKEYREELLAELEVALQSIPDQDYSTYTIKILSWEDEEEEILPTNPVDEVPRESQLKPAPTTPVGQEQLEHEQEQEQEETLPDTDEQDDDDIDHQ
ncbi:hypothetical protein RIVERRIDER_22 [Xanthomonas phage RiverRider]|uniref:Uncharacterized protein n=1 Tax=Xanthomonas phage RiverRider TaxID=2108116 RepID=A0A2P1JUS5_9CAUD|nr:hypothetical protein HWB58_gp22 [Xanthomonas phage RiverRider]AVO23110.1 hypothetical protein RIVERRIDER_22 [Xanthomonas phage RiverRider]